MRLLITDDSTFARIGIRKMVKKLRPDWDIEECTAATAALVRLREVDKPGIDVIMVDYHMPQMNGLAFAASVLKMVPGVKICLVTANLQQQLKDKCGDLGIDFLGKPTTEDAVAAFLDKAGE